jgi:hypothetical protein
MEFMKIEPPLPDDVVVNLSELAKAMRVSLQTISRHIHKENYRPEFGRTTTIGHYKVWLRAVLEPQIHSRRVAAAKREAARRLSPPKSQL